MTCGNQRLWIQTNTISSASSKNILTRHVNKLWDVLIPKVKNKFTLSQTKLSESTYEGVYNLLSIEWTEK